MERLDRRFPCGGTESFSDRDDWGGGVDVGEADGGEEETETREDGLEDDIRTIRNRGENASRAQGSIEMADAKMNREW